MNSDGTAGFADRHAGQAANLAASTKPHRDDRARVETAAAALAASGNEFTANDVHALLAHDGGPALSTNVTIAAYSARGPKTEPFTACPATVSPQCTAVDGRGAIKSGGETPDAGSTRCEPTRASRTPRKGWRFPDEHS